jgi:hypothetical protein
MPHSFNLSLISSAAPSMSNILILLLDSSPVSAASETLLECDCLIESLGQYILLSLIK